MGRRDPIQVTLEVVARMRQLLPNLVVTYEPGWETRGNGTSADYVGGLVHHTAAPSTEVHPFPSQTVLRDGRSDLDGPLCNESVPWCTVDRPRLHVMAANPANHAGASGGRSMGPLPVTRLFNPKVRGLEIDYAGTVAMVAGQLLVALAWALANADVVGGGDIESIRAHFETSVTGKWDIGAGGSRSVDMGGFRRDAANFTVEDDMQLTDRIPDIDARERTKDPNATISVGEALSKILELVAHVPADVVNRQIPDPDKDAREGTKNATSPLWAFVQAGARAATNAQQTIAAQGAALTALTQLVAQQNGLTIEDVRQALRTEIQAGVPVHVTVGSD